MLTGQSVHPSWSKFLDPQVLSQLQYIENNIGRNYTPSEDLVLRFLGLDLDKMKVLVLGQDPYPQPGVANGRSFQPSTLKSWTQSYKNNSIKNLLRLIYKEYYGELVKYGEINWSKFQIKAPIEWFDSLEEQGVLFLNTSFTCEIGESNSHSYLWVNFTHKLIDYISTNNKDMYWLLFGNNAKEYSSIIKSNHIIKSPHPMMGSKDFFESQAIKETKDFINWLG